MEKNIYKNLFVHSAIIFVAVFILTTQIHEGMHVVTAKLFGLQAELHHNYVSSSGEESSGFMAKVMVPASGPLISLLQGIIFLLLAQHRNEKSLLTLFYLWMSIIGFITALGYVAMTPLFAYGDTGKVFTLLGTPDWLKWIIGAGGIVAFIIILRGMAGDFARQFPKEYTDEKKSRRKILNFMITFPVLMGVVLSTFISLPVPTFLSLLYPLSSPFATFMIYGKLRRSESKLEGMGQYPNKISLQLVIFTLILVIITRLLVPGVKF